jgi:hypothetical protein
MTSVTTTSTADRAGAPLWSRSRTPERVVRPFVSGRPALRLLQQPDRRDDESRARLLSRVRGEFSEMPCMRVTCAEAARLFGLRPDVCARVLDDLAGAGDIRQGPDGRFSRLAPVL